MISDTFGRTAPMPDPRPLRRLEAMRTWRGVLILSYHRVGDGSSSPFDRSLWSASAEALDAHLELLVRSADVIGPSELTDALASTGRRVMLTFDDGYRDSYEIALPRLRAHGLPATFFLATGFLDRPRAAWWDELAWMVRHGMRPPADPEAEIRRLTARYQTLPPDRAAAMLDEVAERTGAGRCPPEQAAGEWMTWDMVRELRDAGMSIGGHTVDHPILSTLPAAEQELQIGACADRLRAELGMRMRWFAYPGGHRGAFGSETSAILTRRNVDVCFSSYGGFQPSGRWDPTNVARTTVGPRCDQRMLRAMLALPQLFARPS